MATFERIFLHAGLHKTGSSTLQACFYEHRDSLAENLSVHYPALAANLSEALYSAFTEAPLEYPMNVQRGLDSDAAVEAWNQQNLATLEAGFRSAETRCALLSGETVSYLSREGLQRLRAWLAPFADQVQVVCVLRDPVSWSVSEAQSEIRGGATLERVNSKPQHARIRRKLENLLDVFGADCVQPLVFEELVAGSDGLVAAFLASLGFPSRWAQDHPAAAQNESMSMEAAWLVSAINAQRPLMEQGRLGAGRWRGDTRRIVAETTGQAFALDIEARRRVAAEAALDIEWLRESFGLSLRCDVGADLELPPDGLGFSRAAVDAVALQLLESAQLARHLDEAGMTGPQLAAAEKSLADLGERLRQLRERYSALEQRAKNQVQRADEAERHAGALQEQLRELEQRREREIADAQARERVLAEELEATGSALDAVTGSLSWRLTRPLRALKARLSRSR